jgi:hypothetical protein
MTLINEKHNYIYVHVYKVAGQSVKLALREWDYRYLPVIKTPLSKIVESPQAYTFRSIEAHSTAAEIRDYLGQEKWDSMFSFSFVRNPWDWQVSLYHFIQINKFNPQRRMVSEMTFDDYIKWRVEEDLHLQGSFIFDRHGKQLVDHVAKLEEIGTEFPKICERIGVQATLPHENRSQHDRYVTYYTDTTRELIAEAFAPDIEAFGYTFDGS